MAASRPRLRAPVQYRLDLYDQRPAKGGVLLQASLECWGDASLTTIVPAGEEARLGEDRVRVTFHFPADLKRLELDEVFRWVGAMAGREVDRIFDEWEMWRLHQAGVPLARVPGTASSYRLDSLALCGPAADKEPPAMSPEPDPAPETEAPESPAAPCRARDVRPKTLAGKRIRYEIVRLKDHAELRFRRGYGHGDVRAVTKVDLEDVDLVSQYAWHLVGTEAKGLSVETDSGPYSGSRVRLQLHRMLLGCGSDERVGFRNGERLDFRKGNLVVEGYARRRYRSNTSGFRGVSLNKKSGKYEASVGRQRFGTYDTAEEAAAVARRERERRGWVDVVEKGSVTP